MKRKIRREHGLCSRLAMVVAGIAGGLIANIAWSAHAPETKSVIAACVECHGENGLKTANGAPYLAGQNANYMAAALRAYAKGQRNHAGMETLAKTLSEPEILAVSQLYAGLSGKWKGSGRGSRATAAGPRPEDIAAGRDAAKPCTSCHGAEGNSTRAGVPSIAGLPPGYLVQAMRAYFSGERTDIMMATFKDALDNRELDQLGAYFSTVPRHKIAPAAAGNSSTGKNAAQSCAGCHGRDGNSSVAEFPPLAALDAQYFAKAMREYRDGQRKSAHMNNIARKMSDTTITTLAAYFAAQEPKISTSQSTTSHAEFDPAGDGERASQACVGCHGDGHVNPQPGTPRLTGLQRDYLVASINAYRSGTRRHDLMKTFVAKLSESDIENIALYWALQTPVAVNANGTSDAGGLEAITRACAACHGDGGNSTNPRIPSLAGQDTAYLATSLEAYKTGARAHDDMRKATGELGQNTITQLAAYFGHQPPVAAPIRQPEAPDVIAAKCDRCHGERGYSGEPGKPRLAGQSEAYLLKALREYKHEARKNSAMHAMSDVLDEIEIRAMAAYYARQ